MPRIDFQQTEVVSVSGRHHAAGAHCQNVSSYFPQTKFRLQTLSSVNQILKEGNSTHLAAMVHDKYKSFCSLAK